MLIVPLPVVFAATSGFVGVVEDEGAETLKFQGGGAERADALEHLETGQEGRGNPIGDGAGDPVPVGVGARDLHLFDEARGRGETTRERGRDERGRAGGYTPVFQLLKSKL